MNKILMLPVLAIVGMISTVSAADPYTPCQEGGYMYCQYESGCQKINMGPQGTADCATEKAKCIVDGWVYKDAALAADAAMGDGKMCPGTFSGEGRTATPPGSISAPEGCCKYNATETKGEECWASTAAACTTASGTFTSGTQANCGGAALTGCTGAVVTPPTEPILQHHGAAVNAGLSLAPHSLGMQISSQKDAKLTMFDARGNTVYSADVVAGLNVVSMQGQKQGVYFAVVTSGSLKQSLKVIVK